MYFPRTLIVFAATAIVALSSACGLRSSDPPDLKIVRTKHDFGFQGGEPFGIEMKDGSLYISDGAKGRLMVIPTEGSSCRRPSDCSKDAVLTDKLHTPSHIAIEDDGSVLVADSGDHTIRRVSPEGEVSLVAGTPGESGFLDGKTGEARFRGPIGIAVDGGRIFVADSYNDRIRVIENGEVRTLAGSGRGYSDGAGNDARFDTPSGLAMLPGGRLLVADLGNRRLRIVDPDGRTITLAGNGESYVRDRDLRSASFSAPTDVALGKSGEIYVADGDAVRVIGARITPIVETITSKRRGFEDREDGLSRFSRVSGVAVAEAGDLFVSDSDNGLVRAFGGRFGEVETREKFEESRKWTTNGFQRSGVWPYDPPDAVREIAGTFGEIRGERDTPDSPVYFHNGLDITGGYGETARFVMDEKLLDPEAVQNVGTLRELIRLPLHGYIHVNIGRTTDGERYSDPRFILDGEGEELSVRVPRGTSFKTAEPVGTLNRMNHVHLVVGAPGREFNGLWGFVLPGVSDSISPVLEKVELFTENWEPRETVGDEDRIKVDGRVRIVAEGYDRMDGNAERRRLGIYKLGYRLFDPNGRQVGGTNEDAWTMIFDELPDDRIADLVYAVGSRSGATGPTVFRYIVSNRLKSGKAGEGFINFSRLEPGDYEIEVIAGDYFGNTAAARVPVRNR
ncbi:MAG: hypothetical protein IPM63_04855 [Acidobacteriota bacterium]|nr:MAG: hypothetical protein IPM63_04855 [Acidobacteriota bacterium]